jgi:hypothetical protein
LYHDDDDDDVVEVFEDESAKGVVVGFLWVIGIEPASDTAVVLECFVECFHETEEHAFAFAL